MDGTFFEQLASGMMQQTVRWVGVTAADAADAIHKRRETFTSARLPETMKCKQREHTKNESLRQMVC
jgi:hypothetical protein